MPDFDRTNNPPKQEDKRYMARLRTSTKETTETSSVSTITGAARTSTSGLLLPRFLLLNYTRNGMRPSPESHTPGSSDSFPTQDRVTQEPKRFYGYEIPEVTRNIAMTSPAYLSADLWKSPPGEEKTVLRRSALVNNRFGSNSSVANTTGTLARLSQEQRIYQSLLTNQPLALSHYQLGSITRQLANTRQGIIGKRKESTLPEAAVAPPIVDEGSETGAYNSKVVAPVSISLNRPLLETLIVQNNAATNADEIRQRVEDVLLEIINSAVSKL